MSLTNPNKVITEERLSEFYTQILPYLGGMPELLANKFNKSDLYSTDEKIVGQWIDGKPLYQRVLVETNITATGSTEFYLSNANKIANCDNYFIISALGYSSDWSGCGVAMGNDYATPINQYMFVITAYNPTTGRCWLLRGTDGWSNVIIVIRYTKTTDTAISIGTDTDYSTTEKIVGTWTDGRPVYQKTYIAGPKSYTANTVTNYVIDDDFSGKELISESTVIEQPTARSSMHGVNRVEGTGSFGYTIQAQNGNLTFTFARQSGTSTFTINKHIITVQYTKTTT